jgi:hypothetical protein
MRPQFVPFLIIGLVALIICGSYLIEYRLEKRANEMSTNLTKVKKALTREDYAAAHQSLHEFKTIWRHTKKYWSMTTDHHEMDEIEMSLARLESLLQRKTPLALEELAVVQHLIRHIPEKERFNWLNVL